MIIVDINIGVPHLIQVYNLNFYLTLSFLENIL